MITKDPETGYIGQTSVGHNYGPNVRCRRCGGRGMWCKEAGGAALDLETILCLRCVDEWYKKADDLFVKHRWKDMRSGPRKWMAAFNDFCQTKPVEVDIAVHNRRIESVEKIKVELKKMVPSFALKIAPLYETLGWQWSPGKSAPLIPSVGEIEYTLYTLIEGLSSDHEEICTGGLRAYYHMPDTESGCYGLAFVCTEEVDFD